MRNDARNDGLSRETFSVVDFGEIVDNDSIRLYGVLYVK